MIKHSVIIITYNQENLISRAIDSVLIQKELLHEIIISDDCSTDSTWNVIQRYYKKYPDLIRPVRNNVNLGIFSHIEKTWSLPTGDIIYYLSGDDLFCDKLFEKANTLIKKNNIDYKNEAFTLYFDFKTITPNGKEYIFQNKLIEKHNPISLKVRNLISNRTTGFSRAVLEKFHPINKKIGIYADGLIDIQTQLYSAKNYYSSYVGSVYFANIGISSRTKKEESLKSNILYLEELKTPTYKLSKNDMLWINYLQYKFSFLLNPNYATFYKYLIYLLKSINFKFGYSNIKKEVKNFIKSFIGNWKFLLFVKSMIN